MSVKEITPLHWQLRRIFSGIGVGVGLSIVACFCTVFLNYSTAFMGGLSSVFAAIVFFEHNYRYKCEMTNSIPHQHLLSLRILGTFGFCASCVAFFFFACLASMHHETPGATSHTVTSVWCFMTAKWSGLLMYFAEDYSKRDRLADLQRSLSY